ncbi:aldo/keto reductase [Candidatus Bathyarchaeota archaeon]|nr:aldo/keto reductase [Candidatus Bathyarchaeota archaeon]
MIMRELGKTGLVVGEIGLGTEHLGRTSKAKATITDVVNKAVKNGINYFDLIFNFEEYIDNYRVAFKGHRNKLVIACHLGSAERSGQYFKTRSVGICEKVFTNTLSKLGTDYVDIANVTYVKDMAEYEEVTKAGSVLDLANRLKKEGKAHHVGISTHDASVVQIAARSGKFEVITYQVNMANNALPGRNEALATCVREGVGVVAMKPFAGGRLLMRNKTVGIIPLKKGGGTTITLRIPAAMTPIRCLAYTLSQIGVSTTIPGVSSLNELDDILSYQDATAAEKDYSEIVKNFKEYEAGQCVYCNHCLPCPSSIDIGRITRLLDIARSTLSDNAQEKYDELETTASECTKCGACMSRCPFDVDIISNMEKAARLFR